MDWSKSDVCSGAVVATGGAERLANGSLPEDFAAFIGWLHRLGMTHLECLKPIFRLDLSFMDYCVLPNDEQVHAENQVFRELFTETDPSWGKEAKNQGLDPRLTTGKPFLKWRNRMLDAQIFNAHL